MRRVDEHPIDPEIAAQLDAIDATLAGEPVDPQHAELAELALLLAAGKPEIDSGFAHSLDRRMERRFPRSAPAAAARADTVGTGGEGAPRPRRWHRAGWGLGAGVVAGLGALVAVVIVGSSGGGGSPLHGSAASAPLSTASAASGTRRASASEALSETASSASPAAAPARSVTPAGVDGVTLQPPANGRRIVQSAQLALSAAPTRIDAVAQEVFNVVGTENGIVNSSNVTATGGPDGSAQFQLSVPSPVLPQAMAALSRLRYANVVSRTDRSADVNNQYLGAVTRLADARALRTGLLKQLANAAGQQQIDSLRAQIHDAEAAISADQAALSGLGHQISFSQISLTIGAGSVPVPVADGSGTFTLARAVHDAGRVLTVAAGIALVALAALVPAGLLAALVWWIAVLVRRRRREQALDLA